jgi:hypothetical protein
MRRRFLELNLGQEAEAVVLGSAGTEGRVPVLTENYLTVQVPGPLVAEEIIRVRIIGGLGPDLVGERVARRE